MKFEFEAHPGRWQRIRDKAANDTLAKAEKRRAAGDIDAEMTYRIGRHSYCVYVSKQGNGLEQRNLQYGTVRRLRKARNRPLSILMALVVGIGACTAASGRLTALCDHAGDSEISAEWRSLVVGSAIFNGQVASATPAVPEAGTVEPAPPTAPPPTPADPAGDAATSTAGRGAAVAKAVATWVVATVVVAMAVAALKVVERAAVVRAVAMAVAMFVGMGATIMVVDALAPYRPTTAGGVSAEEVAAAVVTSGIYAVLRFTAAVSAGMGYAFLVVMAFEWMSGGGTAVETATLGVTATAAIALPGYAYVTMALGHVWQWTFAVMSFGWSWTSPLLTGLGWLAWLAGSYAGGWLAAAAAYAWTWVPGLLKWPLAGLLECLSFVWSWAIPMLTWLMARLHAACVVWTPSCPALSTAVVVILVLWCFGRFCRSWRARVFGVTMYHGTSAANARSILKNGFRPSSGGMLGAGVYASRDINKAKRYGDGTILTLRVSVGSVKEIRRQSDRGNEWQKGSSGWLYDSAWVVPGVQPSGEEHCIKNPKRLAVVSVKYS